MEKLMMKRIQNLSWKDIESRFYFNLTIPRSFSNLTSLLLCLILMLFHTSCFKEEKRIPAPPKGNVETVQIPLTSQYDKQYFFDLFNNTIVSSNSNLAWDLAFETSENGYHIWLNSSRMMFAWNTNRTDFEAVRNELGAQWKSDEANGNPQQTAIGEWGVFDNNNVASFHQVYLIDRGFEGNSSTNNNTNASKLEMRKVIFEGLVNGVYRIRFAKLNGTDDHTVEIAKDAAYNKVFLSFDNGGKAVKIEPPKNDWDLLFTRYTHIFPELDSLPYLVAGALLNISGVEAVKDSSLTFGDITLETINSFTFSSAQDAIGYDWKTFDLDETRYSIKPDFIFILKDKEGNYYKMRFIDFFNNAGERGYPTFEYQML